MKYLKYGTTHTTVEVQERYCPMQFSITKSRPSRYYIHMLGQDSGKWLKLELTLKEVLAIVGKLRNIETKKILTHKEWKDD